MAIRLPQRRIALYTDWNGKEYNPSKRKQKTILINFKGSSPNESYKINIQSQWSITSILRKNYADNVQSSSNK